MTYNSFNFLQFTQPHTDSTIGSFLAYPDSEEIELALAVELTGIPLSKEGKFKISVVPELTSAPPDNYEIAPEFIFGPNRTVDSCRIKLRKTPEISKKSLSLVLELCETDDFKTGHSESCIARIHITNVLSKPTWWNDKITRYYLGDYSDKKYLLFIKITGKSEINPQDEEEVRYNTLLLKYHLIKEKEAGRTVYEDNGLEMQVNLIIG